MAMSKEELNFYMALDLEAHYPPLNKWRAIYFLKYPILNWQRRLRLMEYYSKNHGRLNVLQMVYFGIMKLIHLHESIKFGFTIPRETFGPGLSIAHWGTIAVEGKARIGARCRIHQGVTIGSHKGQVPTIGDNCFIGANATIVGGVTIGNNVTIGANALVNRSFGDGAVLVGVPAKNIA